jgi:imidazolonepropionase-like amidohydrolase
MKIALLTLACALFGSGIEAQDLAITDAKVYPSPNAQPTTGTTILIRGGKIYAVGKNVNVPAGIRTLPCADCIVFAGFWNTHVHFTEPKWNHAATIPAAQLTQQMQQMLSHSGFTTVVDTGSDPSNTIALRSRIHSGEVIGPQIYTAGSPLYPVHGIPFYLRGLPPEELAHFGQPGTPADAAALVEHNVDLGADLVKLFTGSYVAPGDIMPMQVSIASLAVIAGHRHGQPVFAHAANSEGIRVAMESGVDVLAHAPDTVEGVDDALLSQVVAQHMAMVPTLKLFSAEPDIATIRSIVYKFHQFGGQLMFGTDTGFVTDYDISEEYRQLYLAGFSFRDVLTMLTSAPVQRFHVADHQGQIAPGMNGDLTILSSDPASGDSAAFTKVRYTIRDGIIIYGS